MYYSADSSTLSYHHKWWLLAQHYILLDDCKDNWVSLRIVIWLFARNASAGVQVLYAISGLS